MGSFFYPSGMPVFVVNGLSCNSIFLLFKNCSCLVCKALLISETGDRHDVPVWDSCIRPQSNGCRPDAMVGVELQQGCCCAVFHHGVE